jgi:membrane-associated phospholipid phosphatase
MSGRRRAAASTFVGRAGGHDSLNRRPQLGGMDRLGQELIHTGRQAPLAVFLSRAPAADDVDITNSPCSRHPHRIEVRLLPVATLGGMRARGRRATATGRWVAAATGLVLFTAALAVDVPVSQAVHRWSALPSPGRTATDVIARPSTVDPDDDGPERSGAEPATTGGGLRGAPWFVKRLLRAPGHLAFTLCLAALLVLRHPLRWRAGAFLLSCAGLGGIGVWWLKWAVGRVRPFHGVPPFDFHSFERGIPGLIANRNLGFPSGDATLAFATAACMGILVPRSRPFFLVAAVVVGAERVLENAHYVSDVVGAAVLGTLCVPLARWLWQFAAGREAAAMLSPMLPPLEQAERADGAAPAVPVRTPDRSPGESRAGASA